jgi:predicted PhzF superfamily epimerase YddE/YHI9
MQLDKNAILDLLHQRGDQQRADQANQELPDQVDTDQHADLLNRLGLDPKELLGRFTGGGLPGS